MALFREEVARELEDQRQQNEQHIAYYMDPNVKMIAPLNKYRVPPMHHPYNYGYNHGYYPAYTPRLHRPNHSISPVRLRNDFGLENSKYDQIEYVERKPAPEKKGYVTEAQIPSPAAQPYKPFQKKREKKDEKLKSKDNWTGYSTANVEEQKIKKDKIDRRK